MYIVLTDCRFWCKKGWCCMDQNVLKNIPGFRSVETILSPPYSSLGSSVGMARGWTAGVPFPAGVRNFSLQLPDLLWDLRNLLCIGHWGLFPLGVKRQGAWSWPLTSIQCRRQAWWSYTSTPLDFVVAWFVIKHRDNITIYLYLIGGKFTFSGIMIEVWAFPFDVRTQ
jgi:hypothetical protein